MCVNWRQDPLGEGESPWDGRKGVNPSIPPDSREPRGWILLERWLVKATNVAAATFVALKSPNQGLDFRVFSPAVIPYSKIETLLLEH
jgi:hypothetical protein